jgi:uncharacterized protein (DUF362 family)
MRKHCADDQPRASKNCTASQPVIYLESLDQGYPVVVEKGLAHVGFFQTIPQGSTVFLKPNFTFPVYRPGVMTSMECLTAVTECLHEHGYKVIIGEADSGGYNRFSIDHVFQRMGVYDLAQRTGATVVNVSHTEPEFLKVRAGIHRLSVPVPKLLFHDVDAFISLPVPKIHMNTLVSMSIKNQWGCIQEPAERLKLHPFFAQVMYELNRRLPSPFAIMDGRYGLNRSGPMQGDVVDLNWLLVANDLVSADRMGCRLMQIDERRVEHLQYFRKQGWWSPWQQVSVPENWESLKREKFYLKRRWTDLPGLACFRNPFLAWLGYRSPLAGFAHWLLYLFREPFYNYAEETHKLQTRPDACLPDASLLKKSVADPETREGEAPAEPLFDGLLARREPRPPKTSALTDQAAASVPPGAPGSSAAFESIHQTLPSAATHSAATPQTP